MSAIQKKTRRTTPPVTALRQLRMRAGISREVLAARTGLSLTWLGLVERRPEFLSPNVAKRLARTLHCRSEDLLQGEGQP